MHIHQRQQLAKRVADFSQRDPFLFQQRLFNLPSDTLAFLVGEVPAPPPEYRSEPAKNNPEFKDLNPVTAMTEEGEPVGRVSPAAPPQDSPAAVMRDARRVSALDQALEAGKLSGGARDPRSIVECAAIFLSFLDNGPAYNLTPGPFDNSMRRIRRLKTSLQALTRYLQEEVIPVLRPALADPLQRRLGDATAVLSKDAAEPPLSEQDDPRVVHFHKVREALVALVALLEQVPDSKWAWKDTLKRSHDVILASAGLPR